MRALVPVKQLAEGKSRLAEAAVDRPGLVREMLSTVVTALLPHAAPVVVSPDPSLESLARGLGADFFLEHAGELNAALEEARSALGAGDLLVALGDLPWLSSNEVARLVAVRAPVVLAPDRVGRGTNLLFLRQPIPFRFGPDSREAHAREARERGLEVAEFRSPGTEQDLDTPDDLERLWTRSA